MTTHEVEEMLSITKKTLIYYENQQEIAIIIEIIIKRMFQELNLFYY